MNKGSGNSSESQVTAVWLQQPGRSRVQRITAADGFRTEYPYAGVTVVAENISPGDDRSASLTVETVRDVFAEGVAFGVEDALRDSFEEASDLIRSSNLKGCSAAALAFSATHVWYALAGNCRIYRIDSDGVKCIVRDRSMASEMDLAPGDPDYMKKLRNVKWWLGSGEEGAPVCGHTRIRRNTTYLAMTSGSWVLFEASSPVLHRKGLRRSLQGWISILARDLKLAYRRQGGALAAVSGLRDRQGGSVSWRGLGVLTASLALAGYLILGNPFSCGEETVVRSDLFSTDTVPVEIVQPISADSVAVHEEDGFLSMLSDSMNADSIAEQVPDISADLPLQAVLVGFTEDTLARDSFAVSVNGEPDPQWENFSPGIYSIAGDTASQLLAMSVGERFPHLEQIRLDRMITVRESGVSDCARWLSSLPADSASSTGVIVETSSSVAGGASWIRNYPVFANGDRESRSGEAGGFWGDSLPDIPVLRNPGCYRLIVVL